MPSGWTASEYVAWSARLAGHPKRVAADLAAAALERVGLAKARATDLRSLDLPSRRALLLAHAAVASPRVLIADAPLQGLTGAAAAFVLRALAAVTEGRGAILAQTRVDPGTLEGSLARGATDVLVFSGGELVIDVPAADLLAAPRLFAVTVRTNAEILRVELLSRGIDLRGGPIRFAATLPHGLGARDILAAAAVAKAAVIDVYPLLT
jgi:ABC-2 type transport system ATP-binding protein